MSKMNRWRNVKQLLFSGAGVFELAILIFIKFSMKFSMKFTGICDDGYNAYQTQQHREAIHTCLPDLRPLD